MNVRRALPLIVSGLIAMALVAPTVATGADASAAQKKVLQGYAADTWESFVQMTNNTTGLTSDNINADTRERAAYTSPTNIGAYMWSTLAARDLGIITPTEAQTRIAQTLTTLASMERHVESGMYYNWYNPDTTQKLTVWPNDGSTVYPFLSSVDNGWLAAALIMVSNSVPELRDEALGIFNGMDFGFYYDPQAGLLRGGFWKDPPAQCSIPGNYEGQGPNVYYTCHHYGSLNTEPRIASYIGIAYNGGGDNPIPATHYFKMWRTFPETCDWGWQEMNPEGETHNYLGVDVYEGHYTYRGMNIVPSWGGSMFEALMVPLLVPEEEWGPQSWGVNHPLYVRAQIEHGLEEANYGYWGFSPSNNPAGGYREYGVDPIGLEPNGYASDQERTYVDYGFEAPDGSAYCRPPQPEPTSYGQGVVTPHASFLAMDYAMDAALENLANLRSDFDAYGWGGFYDAINVGDPETGLNRGQTSRYYLALDQGMIMAAIANELKNDRLQSYFTQGAITKAIKPILAMEEFTAGEAQ